MDRLEQWDLAQDIKNTLGSVAGVYLAQDSVDKGDAYFILVRTGGQNFKVYDPSDWKALRTRLGA